VEEERSPAMAVGGRRVPSQERGRRRVALILDAAEEVFAESGYEAATNTEIAGRAGASIGSVYQFFPNKEAIFDAVADRYLRRLRALYDEELSVEAAGLPLPEVLDRVMGPLAEFKAENPAFWTLFYGSESSEKLASAAEDLRSEVVGRLETIFAKRAPGLDEEQRRLYAEIVNDVVRGLFPLALSGDAARKARVVAEIKALLLAYLGPVFGTGALP
jgi:AcrR family transcriptional regulator